MTAEPYPSGPFRAFRYRHYPSLWLANFFSYTSRWMQVPLLAWMILELTDSPWLVSLVGFFSMLPTLLLGLVGGILVDRVDRRRLMTLTQAIALLASCALAFLMLTDAVRVWHAYAAMLITGACWALSFPARRAAIFDLVGSTGVTNAIALDAIGMNGSRMVGPGVAGLLIGLTGVAGGAVAVAVCYALGYVFLLPFPAGAGQPRATTRQPVLRNLLEGIAYVRGNPVILATVLVTLIINLLMFPYVPLVTVVARDVLHVGPTLIGTLQAAEGLGSSVGASLIALAVGLRYHGRVYVGGSLLALLALFAFSVSEWYIVSFPVLFLLGLGMAGFATMQSALILILAKDEMRGRALGVISLAIGAGPVGSLLIGAVADNISPVFAIRVFALMGIMVLSVAVLVLPRIMDATREILSSERR